VDRFLNSGVELDELRYPWPKPDFVVHRLDASTAMLSVARAKQQCLPASVAGRLFLTEGNMREFELANKFAGVYSTFRSFQHLHSPEDQENCLCCVHRHLRTDGILVLNLFDPRYDLLLPGERVGLISSRIVTHPISGNTVQIEVLRRVNDSLSQCFTETWRSTEFGPDNALRSLDGGSLDAQIVTLFFEFEQLDLG
jgi:SAM-dependent methyltransferase